MGATIETNLKNELLEIIFEHVNKEESIVFLFGSFAQNTALRGSDIDLGILLNTPLKSDQLYQLKEGLNEKAHTLREIDLVDFTNVKNRTFIKNALKETDLWYQGKECKIIFGAYKERFLS